MQSLRNEKMRGEVAGEPGALGERENISRKAGCTFSDTLLDGKLLTGGLKAQSHDPVFFPIVD